MTGGSCNELKRLPMNACFLLTSPKESERAVDVLENPEVATFALTSVAAWRLASTGKQLSTAVDL